MKVRDLLNSSGRHSRISLARNHKGEPVPVRSTEAVSWSIIGALMFVYPNRKDYDAAYKKIASTFTLFGYSYIGLDKPSRELTWSELSAVLFAAAV